MIFFFLILRISVSTHRTCFERSTSDKGVRKTAFGDDPAADGPPRSSDILAARTIEYLTWTMRTVTNK